MSYFDIITSDKTFSLQSVAKPPSTIDLYRKIECVLAKQLSYCAVPSCTVDKEHVFQELYRLVVKHHQEEGRRKVRNFVWNLLSLGTAEIELETRYTKILGHLSSKVDFKATSPEGAMTTTTIAVLYKDLLLHICGFLLPKDLVSLANSHLSKEIHLIAREAYANYLGCKDIAQFHKDLRPFASNAKMVEVVSSLTQITSGQVLALAASKSPQLIRHLTMVARTKPKLEPIDVQRHLLFAAQEGRSDMIELLLLYKKAGPPDAATLQTAVKQGHLECVRLLLDAGAPMEGMLLYAAGAGKSDVLHLLLAKGADLKDVDAAGDTALHKAAGNKESGILKSLLQTGKCNVDATNQKGEAPLLIAARMGCEETALLLLDWGANPNASSNDDDLSPIHYAVKQGMIRLIERLIASCNMTDKKGSTPLHHAVASGQIEAIASLLKAPDINPNLKGRSDETPLAFAVARRLRKSIEALLESDKVESNEALAIAVSKNFPELVTLLVQKGADVNAPSEHPLHSAVAKRLPELVKLLLGLGAKVDALALTIAKNKHFNEISALLEGKKS